MSHKTMLVKRLARILKDHIFRWGLDTRLCLTFAFSTFFFFFLHRVWTITSHGFTIQETKCTVHALLTHCSWVSRYYSHIKKLFYYSVFSFQQNKLYPNGPLVCVSQGWTRILCFFDWSHGTIHRPANPQQMQQ